MSKTRFVVVLEFGVMLLPQLRPIVLLSSVNYGSSAKQNFLLLSFYEVNVLF
ncbi:hypothetical protein COLO4_31403 [Corchorus olitorius]|uniref:Uncharacterized protein n=1 Tax=Corchorus olitorius TaxID=93759 RepID=A0A1R3H4J4_9ROSI|nr:hypothetical protein COLO4_31403 [Corchorus olitorius]